MSMNKKYQKIIIAMVLMVFLGGLLVMSQGQHVWAAKDINSIINDQIDDLNETGLPGETDNPYDWVITLIRAVLGTLGVIFLVLVIYAGIKWMTSGGSESTIGDAKKLITNAVIGLVIIALSFAITQFVFSVILKAQ